MLNHLNKNNQIKIDSKIWQTLIGQPRLAQQLGAGSRAVVYVRADNEQQVYRVLRSDLEKEQQIRAEDYTQGMRTLQSHLLKSERAEVIPEHLRLGAYQQINLDGSALFPRAEGDLEKYLDQALSADEIYRFYWELYEQLLFFHQHSIGIGDIKPANILIFEGEDGRLHPVFSDLDGYNELDQNGSTTDKTDEKLVCTPAYLTPYYQVAIGSKEKSKICAAFDINNLHERDSYALHLTFIKLIKKQIKKCKLEQDKEKLQKLLDHCKNCAGITSQKELKEALREKEIQVSSITKNIKGYKVSFLVIPAYEQKAINKYDEKVTAIKNEHPILTVTQLAAPNDNQNNKDQKLEEAQQFIEILKNQVAKNKPEVQPDQQKDNNIKNNPPVKFTEASFSTGNLPIGPAAGNLINEMAKIGLAPFYQTWRNFENHYDFLQGIINQEINPDQHILAILIEQIVNLDRNLIATQRDFSRLLKDNKNKINRAFMRSFAAELGITLRFWDTKSKMVKKINKALNKKVFALQQELLYKILSISQSNDQPNLQLSDQDLASIKHTLKYQKALIFRKSQHYSWRGRNTLSKTEQFLLDYSATNIDKFKANQINQPVIVQQPVPPVLNNLGDQQQNPNQVKIELRKAMISKVLEFLGGKLKQYYKNYDSLSPNDKAIATDLELLRQKIKGRTDSGAIYQDDEKFNNLANEIMYFLSYQHEHQNNLDQSKNKQFKVVPQHDLSEIKNELLQDEFLKENFGQNINNQQDLVAK